jgi:hypothetical protein
MELRVYNHERIIIVNILISAAPSRVPEIAIIEKIRQIINKLCRSAAVIL